MRRWQKQDRRWNNILNHIKRAGSSWPAEIARAVGAHPETIRRDLVALEKRKLVKVDIDPCDRRCKEVTLGEWFH